MSLITEEERELFRRMPADEFTKLVEKRKGGLGMHPYLLSGAKISLREDYFWCLADPDKTLEDKSEELGVSKRTVMHYINTLRKAGFLRQSELKYSKEVLEEAKSRYGDLKKLREAVGKEISVDRVFTCHDLCEALGIPSIPRNQARRYYGVEYNVYAKLHGLLTTSIRRGEIEYSLRGKKRVYRCLKPIETSGRKSELKSEYLRQEKIKADVLKLSEFLAEFGPCTSTFMRRNTGFTYEKTKKFLKLVENITVIQKPETVKYDFFSECFGAKSKGAKSKLLMDTKNEGNLQRMTDMLIGRLPEEVYPWFREDIERQLGYMCKNGLPDQVVKSVRAAYVSKLVEV